MWYFDLQEGFERDTKTTRIRTITIMVPPIIKLCLDTLGDLDWPQVGPSIATGALGVALNVWPAASFGDSIFFDTEIEWARVRD